MGGVCVRGVLILVNIGSGNDLSSVQLYAVTQTNHDVLSIEPLGTNFREIVIKIKIFLLTKTHFKMLYAKW